MAEAVELAVAGRSGVWLPADDPSTATPARPERKVAAIGVRVAAGTTMHGFAINVDPDLAWFDKIVPCGITDAGVTSLTAELGDSTLSLHTVAHVLRPHLDDLLSFTPYDRSPDLHAAPLRPAVTYGLTV